MIESIIEQDERSIDPRNMEFSKECRYVFQKLKRECANCGKGFDKWYSKIQHVSSSPECAESGADNIEKKLSNEMYALSQQISRIRKKNGRFYSVIEKMIDLTQNENISYSSNVP